ncbi:hypothetical protein F2Q70_00008422 [Brassica cretica]|uniref:Uncharacterized protein n=1 Tax=Brassica cretica TaxID=69181 RepID=A0A8S9M313_BRACR|nr:hypothetical protein F2Q70_00008422 [Brassica cretica]KAF3546982.1 hypothetical protein DY000_02001916 [Brassica cretica]
MTPSTKLSLRARGYNTPRLRPCVGTSTKLTLPVRAGRRTRVIQAASELFVASS